MFECSSLFEASRNFPKQFPKLEKKGVVKIYFKGDIDSAQINKILYNIHFIINRYKKSCKKICFICQGVFKPADMFVYVLFETFVYTLIFVYNYNVEYSIGKWETTIQTPGLRDSLLLYFYDCKYDKKIMSKYYNFVHNKNHFRRIILKEDIQGVSKLLGELKLFLKVFDINEDYALSLAKVGAELVDNANEHAKADCLIDIYVSDPTYYKKEGNDYYYAINMVVINFSDKELNHDIKKKINNCEYENSERYNLVTTAYNNHKKYFKKDCYEIDDFFNLASFQHEISGREYETESGGKGLTDLIKSLEDKAESHCCYILSKNKGIKFEPQYLKYNEDNWIGFNEENNFIDKIPDESIILRSNIDFLGTGYNFTLVVKKEDNK